MKRPLLTLVLCATLAPVVFGAVNSSSHSRVAKSLPLDRVPGAVLKTRENSQYLKDRIIIKLMPEAREVMSSSRLGIPAVDAILTQISATSIDVMFPAQLAERDRKSVDLTRFVVVKYSSPVDPFSVSEELSRLEEVQYAEPWFIYPISYDPNDPFFSTQYGMSKIQAPAAWDLTQGDTSVVIGIVDSGVDILHPDLSGNIWHNPGEIGTDGQGRDKETNGTDDDGNGYVDDWRGWDFGGADYNNVVPDNNPSPTGGNNAHGTHVSGIASASTDNETGVAGVGFHCRLLAIKTAADNDTRGPGGTGFIIAGDQGIVYAAALGADVMNCSWGGGGGSQVEQDIINWATAQGTLVVAAAGNNNSSGTFYPAGYQNVLSAAATGPTDVKASYSNYGYTVDVAAPGDNVYSTYFPSTYAYLSGTSMASPHTAGAAAIVKAMNPGFTPLQVGERLRVTSDNINGINPSYTDLLGKGRINLYRALTEDPPSIRGKDFVISDSTGGNNNGIPEPNETVDLIFTFTNFLAPTSNATVTLTETSPYLTVVDGDYAVGALGTLDTVRNSAEPFQVSIAGNVPPGYIATIKLLITDGTYSDYQWFTLVVNPTFQNHDINNVHVTMTNNGHFGWNDYPANLQGIGFLYPAASTNHLFEGGLIMGYSATKLVNNIRDNGQQIEVNDYLARGFFQLETPGIVSSQDGYAWFSDSLAPVANRIGLRVDEYSYAFSSPMDSDYVIVRYDITNLGASAVSGLYVGQFFDWDIVNYATNMTDLDQSRSLAYAWDSGSPTTPYLGVRALDSVASCRGLVNSSLTIDRNAEWGWISGGTGQSSVGPGDIFFVISSGPYTIEAGSVQQVGFAMLGGADLVSLQSHADAARAKWNEIISLVSVDKNDESIPGEYALEQNYPNPFNPTTVIQYTLPEASVVTLKVFDVLGREVSILVHGRQSAGNYNIPFDARALPTGVYFYRLTAGGFSDTKKLMLVK